MTYSSIIVIIMPDGITLNNTGDSGSLNSNFTKDNKCRGDLRNIKLHCYRKAAIGKLYRCSLLHLFDSSDMAY